MPKLHVEWKQGAGRPTIDVGSRLSIHLFPIDGHWLWGLVKDWYDGPHYLFGVGPLILIAWW